MRILIATGGASHSAMAVKMGAELAQSIPLQVTVLTVIKGEKQRATGAAILANAQSLLEMALPPGKIETKIRVGQAADEIVKEASHGHYRLAIIGEREHHDLVARILGPTAERVIHRAYCPVLIAKKRVGPLENILLCDSGLPEHALLSRMKTQLPELLFGSTDITVLHVMSQISAGPGVSGSQLRADATELIRVHSPEGEMLSQDVRQLALSGVTAHPKVRHGLVVDEILAEASRGNYDLVVIGAHKNGGWQRLLLDDLAHQIVLRADRPILVVR